MTYVEIAISAGPGTLWGHEVINNEMALREVVDEFTYEPYKLTLQTLTESEAQEWHDIHGGWVAV